MRWKPILIESEKDTATRLVLNIAETLFEDIDKVNHPSFMNGKGGIALFYAYLFKVFNVKDYLDKSITILEIALEESSNVRMDINFGSGYSGISWLISHLVNNKFLEANIKDTVGNLDTFLKTGSYFLLEEGEYDILLGGLGPFHYFLEIKDLEYVEKCIEFIDKLAIREKNTVRWPQSRAVTIEGDNPMDTINLGLAHGIPSLIVFLSICYENNIKPETVFKLIKEAINYLFEIKFENKNCFFPFSIQKNKTSSETPLRWCYGDLGVIMSIFLAGRITKQQEWIKSAIGFAKISAQRINEADTIQDSHLCHGTAGIAHIFNRFYNYTEIDIFRKTAEFWYLDTIKRAKYHNNRVSFEAWKGDFGWMEIQGFLEGTAGIGLSILSAISDIEPKWDRCLLLS